MAFLLDSAFCILRITSRLIIERVISMSIDIEIASSNMPFKEHDLKGINIIIPLSFLFQKK